MTQPTSFLRNSTFSTQLRMTIGLGLLLLAVVASVASSFRGDRQIRNTLIRQSESVVLSLAAQSRLALLSGSPENAKAAIEATLSFPDITSVQIFDAGGKVLLTRGAPGNALDGLPAIPRQTDAGVVALELENDAVWSFATTVELPPEEVSPFSMSEAQGSGVLGSVRVVQSKNVINALRKELFLSNLMTSVLFAILFLALVELLSRRLTRPLDELAHTMSAAQSGQRGVRVKLAGPRDIADMEHAFNSMMSELEDREADLIQSRDSAVAYANLKSQFAATVSHEIRTPLNGVIGSLNMLRASRLPAKIQLLTEMAWDSARQLLDMVNGVLDFSRLEAGKIELNAVSFDLRQMIEDLIDAMSPQAYEKGLELGHQCSAELNAAWIGDADRIRQILTNLIGNAIKFTERGDVWVTIDQLASAGDPGARVVRFTICDTGPGIDIRLQERIFESFTQGDASSTRQHAGSGLGLAISRQLATLMGGHIAVQSAPGQGSRFTVTLPLRVAPSSATGTPTPLSRPCHVLVVADSRVCREYMETELRLVGAEVHASHSATLPRLLHAGAVPYDLIFVDGTTSPRLLQQLREHAACQHAHWIHMAPLTRLSEDYQRHWFATLAKPLRRSRIADLLAKLDKADSGETPPGNIAQFHILVVEDNRTNQVIVRSMLEMLGLTVELANDGHAALRAHAADTWDLILMDCRMPAMDGNEATREIRAREQTTGQHTPIIAMSAETSQEDIDRSMAAGMDDHLAKPLTLDALAAALRRWLEIPLSIKQIDPDEPDDGLSDNAVDPGVIGRLRDALGGAIDRAIEPFLEDMPKIMDALDAAIHNGDTAELKSNAHQIKGAAGNLGAYLLAQQADMLEQHAGDSPTTLNGHLNRLRKEFQRVATMLRTHLPKTHTAAPTAVDHGARVLVVDDDRSTRSALRYALELNGFHVHEADSGTSAIDLLSRCEADLVLLDAVMPGTDGFATCTQLKELPEGQEIPVLMITSLDDRQSIERAFAAGASDYITKPLHLNVVVQRVRRTIDASRSERRVRHLAYTDVLTGLPNRTHFQEHLQRLLNRTDSLDRPLAVLFLDLDRFKFVNDSLGHEIGDRLLAAAARRITHSVRTGDCVARLGGDEFTVVVEDLASPAMASTIAKNIATDLSAPYVIDGHDIFVTASVGIALYPRDGEDLSTLLRHADTAMYRAKHSNHSFVFYEAAMEATTSESMRLERDLRLAIERQEFELHYQPEIDTRTGQLVATEALVRWRHPERGMLGPNEFIPMAEETGLILPLGEWVLHTACAQLKAWHNAGHDIRIAVNFSGQQLEDEKIATTVEEALAKDDIPADALVVELTESIWMDRQSEAIDNLYRLKRLGVRLAIDDFGTGYSSLSYLKRMPVDILKVDRSFVTDLAHTPGRTDDDDTDAAIVRGIIALAHNLDLQVVAEGVETDAQRKLLTQMGCDLVQGYLISKPLAATQFELQFLSGHGTQASAQR